MNHGVTIHGKLLLTILKKKKQIFYARRNYTLDFAEISQKAKEKDTDMNTSLIVANVERGSQMRLGWLACIILAGSGLYVLTLIGICMKLLE